MAVVPQISTLLHQSSSPWKLFSYCFSIKSHEREDVCVGGTSRVMCGSGILPRAPFFLSDSEVTLVASSENDDTLKLIFNSF